MKAITVHQPYASLIAEGVKTIETRSWKPPQALIGKRIAIHAAKRKIGEQEWIDMPMGITKTMYDLFGARWRMEVPYGAVVATATILNVTQVEYLSEHEGKMYAVCDEAVCDEIEVDPYGDFNDGRWLWILDDIQKLAAPIPAIGKQGFWEWDA